MSSSRGEIARGIAVLVVFGVLIYLIHRLLPLLNPFVPEIKGYETYLFDILAVALSLLAAHVILRTIHRSFEAYSAKSKSRRNLGGLYVLLRILIYAVAIFSALALVGVNVQDALLGGAIGGIAIGFAIQNVASYLLSGIMVSAAGALKPKEMVFLQTSIFPGYVVGEVLDVNVLFTDVRDQYGQINKIPNSTLLGSTLFRSIKDGEFLKFYIDITVPGDVRIDSLRNLTEQTLLEKGEKLGIAGVSTFFKTYNQSGSVVTTIFKFKEISRLNEIISFINSTYQESYSTLKK
jgi:small-conductance mechanosensitive channel